MLHWSKLNLAGHAADVPNLGPSIDVRSRHLGKASCRSDSLFLLKVGHILPLSVALSFPSVPSRLVVARHDDLDDSADLLALQIYALDWLREMGPHGAPRRFSRTLL